MENVENLDYLDTDTAGIDTRTPLIPDGTVLPVIIKSEVFKPFKTIEEGGKGSVGANFNIMAVTDAPVEGNLNDMSSGLPMMVASGTMLRHSIMCLVTDKSQRKHWDEKKLAQGITYVTEFKEKLAKYDEAFVGIGNARNVKTSSRVDERVLAVVGVEATDEGKEYNVIKWFKAS
ncbi:hypothetical protein N9064_00565 [bacterium]|nr:hypothetical protein [bacterium]